MRVLRLSHRRGRAARQRAHRACRACGEAVRAATGDRDRADRAGPSSWRGRHGRAAPRTAGPSCPASPAGIARRFDAIGTRDGRLEGLVGCGEAAQQVGTIDQRIGDDMDHQALLAPCRAPPGAGRRAQPGESARTPPATTRLATPLSSSMVMKMTPLAVPGAGGPEPGRRPRSGGRRRSRPGARP